MKYIILVLVIILVYRFYNIKKQVPKGEDQFPNQPPKQEPELGDYSEYEELE